MGWKNLPSIKYKCKVIKRASLRLVWASLFADEIKVIKVTNSLGFMAYFVQKLQLISS